MTYISFFKLRFNLGLQYRGAAIAGMFTQIVWGLLQIIMYHVFYSQYESSFPMSMSQLASYIWLQQAFLSLFNMWMFEAEIFDSITSGDVCYDLCKPQDIYSMWFARSIAKRLSAVVLRMFPVLLISIFIPRPYGLELPSNATAFILFLISLFFGLLVVVAFTVLIYIICFYTISAVGVRMLAASICELLTGALIPLPFFPEPIRKVAELLPFASMQNVPLRIYSGNIQGLEVLQSLLLQGTWALILVLLGRILMKNAVKKLTVMGG